MTNLNHYTVNFSPLSHQGITVASGIYKSFKYFFPLIASILEGSQKGKIFGNHPDKPHVCYVEHSFGFSQVFACPDSSFEKNLKAYLFQYKDFSAPKVRLYTPLLPHFLNDSQYDSLRSERQRFVLDRKKFNELSHHYSDIQYMEVNSQNWDYLSSLFPAITYFWPDATSFIRHAAARIILYDGKPASLCYSAATADAKAEIDIITLPEYRGKGLALKAAIAFIQSCFKSHIEPLWDCFTNNAGSLAVAKKLGFIPLDTPYKFYTIIK